MRAFDSGLKWRATYSLPTSWPTCESSSVTARFQRSGCCSTPCRALLWKSKCAVAKGAARYGAETSSSWKKKYSRQTDTGVSLRSCANACTKAGWLTSIAAAGTPAAAKKAAQSKDGASFARSAGAVLL